MSDVEAQDWQDMAADWRRRYDAAAAELAEANRLIQVMSDDADEEQGRLEARAEAAEQAVARVRNAIALWHPPSAPLAQYRESLLRTLDGEATP